MADASIIIDGGIVTEPRWNNPGQSRVGNLTVRAGRSRKNDQGGYDQLSSTAYDVACWNEVHDLLAAQMPEKGAQVRITGTVTGVHTYQDQQGETQASVEVRAEGVKVFPKRQQQGGYGSQGGQNGAGWAGAPQGSGAPGYGAPTAPQGGYGSQNDPWAGGGNQGGYDDPPF